MVHATRPRGCRLRVACVRAAAWAYQFLDPLDEYHKEFARVLKPGGMLVWTCKEMVKTMDKSVYKNTDWPTVVESMKKAGLNGSVGAENKGVHDIPVIGKK